MPIYETPSPFFSSIPSGTVWLSLMSLPLTLHLEVPKRDEIKWPFQIYLCLLNTSKHLLIHLRMKSPSFLCKTAKKVYFFSWQRLAEGQKVGIFHRVWNWTGNKTLNLSWPLMTASLSITFPPILQAFQQNSLLFFFFNEKIYRVCDE